MRKHKPVEHVTRTECCELSCDRCGKKSTVPSSGGFDDGFFGTVGGSLVLWTNVNGDVTKKCLELCYECVSKLINQCVSHLEGNTNGK